MAKKVERPRKKSSAPDGAEDLEILHPERIVTIGGRTLTVREYSFVEGLRLRPLYQPLLDALYETMQHGEVPRTDEVQAILAEHLDATLQLIAVAADTDVDYVSSLNLRDGNQLLDAWWGANGPFFLRNVFDRMMHQKILQKARAGQTPTNSSSSTDTTRSESATTPSGKSSSTSAPPVAPKTGKEAKP